MNRSIRPSFPFGNAAVNSVRSFISLFIDGLLMEGEVASAYDSSDQEVTPT
jgi:hypothetical protein